MKFNLKLFKNIVGVTVNKLSIYSENHRESTRKRTCHRNQTICTYQLKHAFRILLVGFLQNSF